MTDDQPHRHETRTVLTLLDESPDWTLRTSGDSGVIPDPQIGRSRANPIRSRYEGEATAGELVATIPDPRGGLAEFVLVNPLDAGLETCRGAFVDALGVAHARSVRAVEPQYTEPLTHVSLIARSQIPSGYDRSTLATTVRALHDASTDVDELHQRLWATVSA